MSVIALDFETSGLNPYHDDIIEIGAKVMGEDKTFKTLVKPPLHLGVDRYFPVLSVQKGSTLDEGCFFSLVLFIVNIVLIGITKKLWRISSGPLHQIDHK